MTDFESHIGGCCGVLEVNQDNIEANEYKKDLSGKIYYNRGYHYLHKVFTNNIDFIKDLNPAEKIVYKLGKRYLVYFVIKKPDLRSNYFINDSCIYLRQTPGREKNDLRVTKEHHVACISKWFYTKDKRYILEVLEKAKRWHREVILTHNQLNRVFLDCLEESGLENIIKFVNPNTMNTLFLFSEKVRKVEDL